MLNELVRNKDIGRGGEINFDVPGIKFSNFLFGQLKDLESIFGCVYPNTSPLRNVRWQLNPDQLKCCS